MTLNTETPYSYKGVPLTPAIIEGLILQLFTGRLATRQSILEEVVRYHDNNGGLKANVQDITSSIKKALNNLKEKGQAANPTLGYWRIGESSIMDSSEVGIAIIEKLLPITQPIADKIIGTGESTIYLYYLPIYRQKAEDEKESSWFCKIGKTERDPLQRVLSQASTALPEKPQIALLIKTDLPTQLESAIHSILTLRSKKVDSAPGSEWFLTSPDEVERIYTKIIEEDNFR